MNRRTPNRLQSGRPAAPSRTKIEEHLPAPSRPGVGIPTPGQALTPAALIQMHRMYGNRAAQQWLVQQKSDPVVQRTMTKVEEIQEDGRGIKRELYRTQPDDHNDQQKQKTLTGLSAQVDGVDTYAPDGWKTKIADKGVDNKGASKGVWAKRLGPDRPAGNPVDPNLLHAYHSHLETRSGQTYQIVSILPQTLGGNGSKKSHLIVVPPDEAEHLTDIHDKLIEIVAVSRGWVSFDSEVKYKNDSNSGYKYASEFKLEYEEYDEANGKVAGTKRGLTMEPPSPSKYKTEAKKATRAVNAARNNNTKGTNDAKHASTAVRFQTRLVLSGTHGTGDGSGIVADPLGPDHKMGEEPKSDATGTAFVWNKRTRELSTAAGNKKYIAGHLLNHHLGGPGNDSRNLTPIPSDVNAKMEREVEDPVKDLVNKEKAWIYYKVDVKHAKDPVANVDYPQTMEFEWHQIGVDGKEVPNTKNIRKLNVKSPSEYAGRSKNNKVESTWDAGAELRNANHPLGAKTSHTLYEIVLEEPTTLRAQKAAILPFIAFLHKHQSTGNTLAAQFAVEKILAKYVPQAASPEMKALIYLNELKDDLELNNIELSAIDVNVLKQALTDIKSGRESRANTAEAVIYQHQKELHEGAGELHQILHQSFEMESKELDAVVQFTIQVIRHVESMKLEMNRMAQHRDAFFEVTNDMGSTPMDADTSPSDMKAALYGAVEEKQKQALQTGLSPIYEIWETPMSPGQLDNFTEDATGERGGNEQENKKRLASKLREFGEANNQKELKDLSNKRTKHLPTKSKERLLALLVSHKANWPRMSELDKNAAPELLVFAGEVEELLPLSEKHMSGYLDALYREYTKLFIAYLEWVSSRVH